MKLHPSNYYSNTSLSEFQLLADESCSPPKEQARVDSGSQLSWSTRREDFSANLLGNFSHRIESKTALFDIFIWGFVCGFAKKNNTGVMSLLFLYNGVMKATGPTTYSVSSEW